MAEGLLRSRHGDEYHVYSAGTQPAGVNPFAVLAMSQLGIDISEQTSDSIDIFQPEEIDFAVTVCDSAREECPYFPAKRENIHHSFPDPSATPGTDEEKLASFVRVRNLIAAWIEEELLPKISARENE